MKLEVDDVSFYYEGKKIFSGISLEIRQGELVLLSGPSGEGKTTLIEVLSGLQQPASGMIKWDEKILGKDIPTVKIDRKRSEMMGLFFWDHRLSSHLTGWENVLLPARLSGIKTNEVFIKEMAEIFFHHEKKEGDDILAKPAGKISAGQQERVAILRAFVLSPPFILADEMLRSLHPELREKLWSLIKKKCREMEIGLLLVTHHNELLNDPDINRKYYLSGGTLSESKKDKE